jgi:alkylhydroperoxidase/carboxymuconolactone decarboxylase family protein YurZ
MDSVVTQLDRERLVRSLHAALDAGASRDEIVSTIELTSVIGLHSVTVGLPVLFGASPAPDRPLDDDERALVAEMEGPDPRPHTINEMYRSLLCSDAGYLRDFVAVIDHPWSAGVLTPRFIHLVCILIDVVCTHLYEPGLRLHVEQALESGATHEEILEVIQLASATGLRTVEAGFGALLDVLQERSDHLHN